MRSPEEFGGVADETISGRELRAVATALREWVDVDALAAEEGLPVPLHEVTDEQAAGIDTTFPVTLYGAGARIGRVTVLLNCAPLQARPKS